MNPQLFFERLRSERERLQLTQDEMVLKTGVSKRSYCAYEAGDTAPSAKLLAALVVAGFDVPYLLAGQRSQPLASSPDEEMLMGAYRRASLAQKQAILGAAIGVAPPPQAVGNVSGGSVVQTAHGNGVVQIGKISGSKPRR